MIRKFDLVREDVQVLQERGESTSRHGRATFSVLLFQVRPSLGCWKAY